jgi:hypothetical protein
MLKTRIRDNQKTGEGRRANGLHKAAPNIVFYPDTERLRV